MPSGLAPARLHWSGAAGRLASAFFDLLVPPVCAACHGPLLVLPTGGDLPPAGPQLSGFCEPCFSELKGLPVASCPRCAEPVPRERLRGRQGTEPADWPVQRPRPCAPCASSRSFGRVFATWLHVGTLADWVARLKYRGELSLVGPLGWLMLAAAPADASIRWDAIVPVPLHARRLIARGFDQSWLLAQPFARYTSLPLWSPLARVQRTAAQVGLAAPDRRQNLLDAFTVGVESTDQLKGARIVLVDDVVTTTSTVEACAAALRLAGAARVDVLALGRAPREPDPSHL